MTRATEMHRGDRPGGVDPPCGPDAGWLAGRWRLDRRIDDRLAGRQGRVAGVLEIAPAARGPGGVGRPGGLVVAERGEMRLGGTVYPVSRRVFWQPLDGGGIEVFFEDGRPFHRIEARDGVAAARHDCGQDCYEVVYRFGRDAWCSLWQVTGPAKRYRMVTRHLRLPGQGG